MRLAIINHHGRIPGGAEKTLLSFVERLPLSIEPIFILFEDGEFAQTVLERYPSSCILSMSNRIAQSTRKAVHPLALIDAVSFLFRLVRQLKAAKIDAVMTNTVKAHFIGTIAAKMAGIPCINYIHDVLEGPGLFVIKNLSRYLAASRIVCSGMVSKNLGLPNTAVVHSPITITDNVVLPESRAARHALGLPIDDLPVVALVGRIAPWKGQDRFIRIAQKVLQKRDAHFVIVGGPVFGCDPAYPESLYRMVAEAKLSDHFHFVPWQNTMANVYAAIDIGCNCSTKEPFGRTTIEAQLFGVPVVCFDDAGVCETFEHGCGGLKVAAGDETAYAGAILRYLLNADMLSQARKDARLTAQQFDIERLAPLFNQAVSAGLGRSRLAAGSGKSYK